MGRKKTPGTRSVGGRKKKASTALERTRHDYGNVRCVERLERFRHKNVLDGKAAWIDLFDGIGQLHAIGMLDGHGLDGKLMREAGREYVGLYNYYFIDMMPKGSDLERAYGGELDRASWTISRRPRGARFASPSWTSFCRADRKSATGRRRSCSTTSAWIRFTR
jgi:hypothetical protein